MKRKMSIYLDFTIINYCKINEVNLSAWVGDRFTKEYMNLERLTDELNKIEIKKNKLIDQIKSIKELNKETITHEDLDLLRDSINRIEKGFEPKAIHKWFCSNTEKSISFDEFMNKIRVVRRGL